MVLKQSPEDEICDIIAPAMLHNLQELRQHRGPENEHVPVQRQVLAVPDLADLQLMPHKATLWLISASPMLSALNWSIGTGTLAQLESCHPECSCSVQLPELQHPCLQSEQFCLCSQSDHSENIVFSKSIEPVSSTTLPVIRAMSSAYIMS